MKAQTLLLIVLALSIGLVSTQDYINRAGTAKLYDATQGAMSRNIYATTIYYTGPNTPLSTASINRTMVAGLFDSTQTISYAAALNDITTPSLNTAPELILQVENITINAARTQFTLNLRFNRNQVFGFSSYATLGYSVIFIGSNFNKQSSPLSAALARTSKLVDVTDTTSPSDSAQFDFVGVTNEPSPFDFIPTASNCGVSKDGTADRIEVLGCSKPIFISFLSGFVSSALNADMSSYNLIGAWGALGPADTDIVSGLQTTATNSLYLYKSGPNDQSVGPKIFFSWGNLANIKQIQLSMVFVGLRSFSAAYPSGISDSFIVAASGLGYGTPITAGNLVSSIDGLKTPAAALNIQNYNGNTGSTMGHLFCGFVQLNTGIASTLNLAATSSDLKLASLNANDAAACLLFATRSTCVSKEVIIPSASFTSVVANPVTVTDRFLGNIVFTGPTVNIPGYSLEIGGYATLTTATKVTITKQYVLPAGRTELVFYSQFGAVGANQIPASTISYVLTLAGVVYPQRIVSAGLVDAAQKTIIHVPSGTTKVTVTFVITINPMATPTSFIVRQSLYYFDKVISSLQSCDTSCPEVTGATTGVTIGANPPACLICQTSLFQLYKNGICQCKTGYYYDASQVCQSCTDAICATCTAAVSPATTTTCTACVPDATLLVSGVCVCNDGFYKNPTTFACQPCRYGCKKCTSLNVCTECQISVNSATLVTRYDAPSCQCIDGYYSVSSSFICEACDSLCLTCSTSATSCDSCDPTKNLYKVGNTCKCVDGFYLLGKQCAPCSASCKTCDISSINCLQCPELRILSGTNNPSFKTCQCDTNKGFVQIDYGCVDSSCTDLDSNCRTCILDLTGLRIRQCLTCSGNRQVVQGKCVCASGYYQDGTTCKACGAGCQTCTSASVCTKCATGSITNGDGTCTCKAGFLLVSFSNSLYCQPCSTNCATCIGSPNVCNTCKPGFQKSGTKCVCSPKTFLSAEGLQCYPCIDKCDICSDADSCLSCTAGYKFQTGQGCLLNCDGATYDDNSGSCQNCPAGCTACYQYGICRSCSDGFYMYAGSCRASCPDGSFPYDNGQYKQCLACPKECETCSSLTQCNKCNSQYVYLAGKCTSDCEKGTYFADGSCRKCDASCAQCTGSATFCTKCQNKYLYNNQCVSTCPVAIVNGQCTATCQDGSFLNGNVCQKCDPKCLTCKGSATTCTSCTTGFSSGGDCVSVCPNNQYASVGFCAPCDISCQTCQQNPFNCIQCANGYIRSGVNCIKSCGQGLYYDSTAQVCLACNSGCQTCLSATQCTQCLDPTFSPIGGICQKACPTGANLIKGVCVCSIGVLHQSTCVSSCPDGLYSTPEKTCALCSPPCYRCSGSSTNCLSCISGYDFDSATKTCKMTSSCPYGAVSSSGTCIKICVQSYFFNGGCIFSCPNGYQPNNYNGCVQSVSPTYCQIPLFQSGNTCVSNCPTSFWPNSVTRTCERCMANCRQCLSDTVCISCANGFSLNYDQTACVQSSTCQSTQVIYKQKCYSTCPYGTYQNGRYCIRSCRSSLYFYEDFCYSSCPTDLQSDDACYRSCPNGIDCRPHH